jgi:hypothetical protein
LKTEFIKESKERIVETQENASIVDIIIKLLITTATFLPAALLSGMLYMSGWYVTAIVLTIVTIGGAIIVFLLSLLTRSGF